MLTIYTTLGNYPQEYSTPIEQAQRFIERLQRLGYKIQLIVRRTTK